MPSCPDFEYDTYGRQGIGVAQPGSGTDFPFVQPSDDLKYLVADIQLTYDDPGDYAGEPFELPFRVHWLYGIGCIGNPPDFCEGVEDPYADSSSSASLSSSGSSSSMGSGSSVAEGEVDAVFCRKNKAEITIVDATNRVVFHSPDVENFSDRGWGDRLHVYQWEDFRKGSCLLVVHTKWGDGTGPAPRNYPVNFFPEDGTLDERSMFRLPKRVRSLTVVLDTLERVPVTFENGFNMALKTLVHNVGHRLSTQVSFDATPGGGLGKFPDCVAEDLYIRTINGVEPTSLGDFYLVADSCYYVRQPTVLLGDTSIPATEQAPGNIAETGLPGSHGWPSDKSEAHLQIGNDCTACCDCQDYVDVAEYMNTVAEQWRAVGQSLEESRDLYKENKTRWNEVKKCFEESSVRVTIVPQLCPYADIIVQYCNQTTECIEGLTLNVEVTAAVEEEDGGVGLLVPGHTIIYGPVLKDGRITSRTEKGELAGGLPDVSYTWDAVNPGQTVYFRFRVGYEGCGTVDGDALTVTAVASADGDPATATATATLNCPDDTETLDELECNECGGGS